MAAGFPLPEEDGAWLGVCVLQMKGECLKGGEQEATAYLLTLTPALSLVLGKAEQEVAEANGLFPAGVPTWTSGRRPQCGHTATGVDGQEPYPARG